MLEGQSWNLQHCSYEPLMVVAVWLPVNADDYLARVKVHSGTFPSISQIWCWVHVHPVPCPWQSLQQYDANCSAVCCSAQQWCACSL
jgi:hypothetical protein